MNDTDNFAYIIGKRRKQEEELQQWCHESDQLRDKIGTFMCFIVIPFSLMLLGACFYSTFCR